MKEMLGGCSVCCDDTGWTENPLVYCDGPNCNVAVHQACYGIRAVPKGEWLCRKCEAFKEKSIKVKCELCPSKDGALKPTENGNWAHVVCALYIPEVTFMDVTIMEPVILSAIPRDRFNRLCYICEEKNKSPKVTTYGACMSCNKSGCKLGFHVTCAQNAGFLCEEAGNYYDNVKYVGYCKQHYIKLKKTTNIKPIVPYGTLSQSETSSSEVSPEKQPSVVIIPDSQTSKAKQKLTTINNFDESSNLVQMPESNPIKKETSVISSPANSKQVFKTEVTDKKVFENNSNAPHMLGNSLNPSSSMAQKMANNLTKEIETHKMFNSESNLSTSASKKALTGPQLQRRNPKPQNQQETPQPQGASSTWSSFSNGINNNGTQALEDLLERQWEQGGAFLMEQAQHFDIASLLTCLYQLKSENVNLEEELATCTRRRDHLLAVNARLAIPLTPQNNRNRASVHQTSNHNEPPPSIQQPRSNYQTNHGNIDPSMQHRYQNHSIHNRHQTHHLTNNMPSQVVIRGGVVQEPKSDNRRQNNNQNPGVLNPNSMYQGNNIHQSPNVTMPHQPKHS